MAKNRSRDDFKTFTDPPTNRMIMSAMALEGAGKTDFMTTAPDPIYVIYTDPNTEDVLGSKRVSDLNKDIRGKRLRLPAFKMRGDREDDIKQAAEEVVEEFRETVLDIVERQMDVDVKTIGIDTGTEIWDQILLADFGRTTRINPRDRGGANLLWRDLFRAVKDPGDINLIVAHRVKQRWETRVVKSRGGEKELSEPVAGEYDRLGMRETGNLVNVEALLIHDPDRDEELEEQFGMKVTRCTQRPGLIGEEYWGTWGKRKIRQASFPWLASQVFPDTDYDDWL